MGWIGPVGFEGSVGGWMNGFSDDQGWVGVQHIAVRAVPSHPSHDPILAEPERCCSSKMKSLTQIRSAQLDGEAAGKLFVRRRNVHKGNWFLHL